MVDISALLSDQPLIDENDTDGGGELDTSLELDDGLSNEPPVDDGGEPPADPPPRNQKVPLAALHEERIKRQQHEADLKVERDNNRELQRQLAQYMIQQQQPPQQQAPQQEAPPAFEEDPVAAFNHLQQQLAASQRQMQDYLQQTQQQSQAQQQHVQLAQTVSAQEAQYTQTVPDYPQAADHFYNRKVAEYTAICGDENRAKQQVATDYRGIALLAQQLGKNPAELMYNAAKAMGYTPGAKPAPRKEAPTSLANVHGAPRAPDEKGAVSAADIADMSEAEFDKYWASISRGGNTKPRI